MSMKKFTLITGAAGFGTTASNANSGRTLINGNVYFPQVVGTKFEREPFAGQQNGLGSKTSEKGLWGVGGH